MKTCQRLAFLVLTAVLATGCFDVEQSLSLQKDLSGTAGFSMTVDMEPMVLIMLQMQRQMADQKGEPTAAEIDKAKKDFLAQQKDKSASQDFAAKRGEFEKRLPAGIQLVEGGVEDKGLKIQVHFKFKFDNVAKLDKIRMDDKPDAADPAAGPGPKNPFDKPFGGVKVTDEGKTVLLTSEAVNPMKEPEKTPEGGPQLDPEMKQQMEKAFKGFRVAFKLETPMEVVESNATRKEGHTLYWEYDLKSVEKMTKEQAMQGIRVRLRK